jgi:phage shock protein PspC (stress-responsive transcriptional regulator)
VVSEEDVVYIMSVMGRPEDIAGEPEAPAAGQPSASGPATPIYTGPREKKLFRDPDNKKVGGVISGLCQYFGWSDPTWIRIGIVAIVALSMFASLGLGFPIAIIYLILLVVVPEASTSAEKLQMRGEPVTIQNIEKEVRDAMTTAGRSISAEVSFSTGGKVGSALMMILRALARIVLVFVVLICVILMLGLITSFFGLSWLSTSALSELTHLVVANRYTIMLFNIGLLLAVGIPLVSVMYDSIRYLTNSQVKNPVLKRVMWGVWFVGIIILGVTSWKVFGQFVATDTTNQRVQLLQPKGGTLYVQLADTVGHTLDIHSNDDEEGPFTFIHITGFRTADGFAFSDLKLEVAVSPDSNFYVEKVSFSRGASFADAGKNIQIMRYKFSQTDTTLNLDNKFELPSTGKWRDQRIKIRVLVPEGKNIAFANNVDQIEASVKGNDYFDDGVLAGRTLHVEAGKIKCLDCKDKVIIDENQDGDQDNTQDDTSDSSAHKITKNMHVRIDNNSDKSELKNPQVNINQNGISVSGKNDKGESVKVKVNENGVRVIKTDSNGRTTVTKN